MKTIVLLFILIVSQLNSSAQVDNSNTRDTVGVFCKVEKEAYFNYKNGWKGYLESNLTVPKAWMDSLPKNTKYALESVEVQFIVCADGAVCEVKTINKVDPALAKESERIIKKSSGKWAAGEQDGKKVKSYHSQKITFVYAE